MVAQTSRLLAWTVLVYQNGRHASDIRGSVCPAGGAIRPGCIGLERRVHSAVPATMSTQQKRPPATRSAKRHGAGAASNGRSDNVSRVYDELRGLIVWGQLPPGARIAERAVAERLGLSRTPVRSALHRLQQEGFVSSVGRGQDQRLKIGRASCRARGGCRRQAERYRKTTHAGTSTVHH